MIRLDSLSSLLCYTASDCKFILGIFELQGPFDCISPPHILLALSLLFTLSAIEAVSYLAGHLSQPMKNQKRVETFLFYKSERDCLKVIFFPPKWLQSVLLLGCKENPKYSFGFNIACIAQILTYWKKTLCVCVHVCHSFLSTFYVPRCKARWCMVENNSHGLCPQPIYNVDKTDLLYLNPQWHNYNMIMIVFEGKQRKVHKTYKMV